jgi:hypothetical protein
MRRGEMRGPLLIIAVRRGFAFQQADAKRLGVGLWMASLALLMNLSS